MVRLGSCKYRFPVRTPVSQNVFGIVLPDRSGMGNMHNVVGSYLGN